VRYVILGSNSARKVQVFGTRTGQPFGSEASAERYARKLDRQSPSIDFLVLPISELGDILKEE